ncbi:MAG: sensor histidine kinase [Treponema sp.]
MQYDKDGDFPALYVCRRLDGGQGFAAFAISAGAVLSAAEKYGVLFALTDDFDRIYASNAALFTGRLGKADLSVCGKQGFVRARGRLFYVRGQPLRHESFTLYAAKSVQEDAGIFALLAAAAAGIFAIVTLSIWRTARFIADKKTRLIDTIVQAFKEAADGNFQKRLSISSPEEFAIIGKSYNAMLESLVALMRSNEEQSKEAIAANLRQMESQFNAHFLFNTLETARFMSRINPAAVESIIMSLSSLLRYSIRQGNETVPLGEDIENVKNYLKILSARFGDRLNCRIRLSPEVLVCRVPKLIFQPIIENSIKYGLEENERVTIEITAETAGENLCIKIKDDGKGIPEENLRELLDGMYKGGGASHIGLYNVHRRLLLMFGKPYGITVVSTENQGTEVSLLLPRIKRQSDLIQLPPDSGVMKC